MRPTNFRRRALLPTVLIALISILKSLTASPALMVFFEIGLLGMLNSYSAVTCFVYCPPRKYLTPSPQPTWNKIITRQYIQIITWHYDEELNCTAYRMVNMRQNLLIQMITGEHWMSLTGHRPHREQSSQLQPVSSQNQAINNIKYQL